MAMPDSKTNPKWVSLLKDRNFSVLCNVFQICMREELKHNLFSEGGLHGHPEAGVCQPADRDAEEAG